MKFGALLTAVWIFAVTTAGAAVVRFNNFGDPAPFMVDGFLIPFNSGIIAIGASTFTETQLSDLGSFTSREELEASFIPFGSPSTIGFLPLGLGGFVDLEVGAQIDPGSPLIGRNIVVLIGDGPTIRQSVHLAVVRSSVAFEADFPIFSHTLGIASALGNDAELLVGRIGDTVHIPEVGIEFPGLELKKIHPVVSPLPPATSIEPISSVRLTTDGLSLTIPIAVNRTIGIEYSSSPNDDEPWVVLGNFAPSSDRQTAAFTDPDFIRLGRERGFYRAFLRPLPE